MGVIDQLLDFMLNGSMAGVPSLVVMTVPFLIGLVVGVLAHKALKVAMIVVIILAAAFFFGVYALDISTLQQLAEQYGPVVWSYGALIIGVLPLSVGFVIGAIVGFIVS